MIVSACVYFLLDFIGCSGSERIVPFSILMIGVRVFVPILAQTFIATIFHGPHRVMFTLIDIKHFSAIFGFADIKHFT